MNCWQTKNSFVCKCVSPFTSRIEFSQSVAPIFAVISAFWDLYPKVSIKKVFSHSVAFLFLVVTQFEVKAFYTGWKMPFPQSMLPFWTFLIINVKVDGCLEIDLKNHLYLFLLQEHSSLENRSCRFCCTCMYVHTNYYCCRLITQLNFHLSL